VRFAPRSLLKSHMTRPFSDLTKDFSPERRERIEQRKEEIRQCLDLLSHLNLTHGSHHHAQRYP
jgi:hypothetical protein